MTFTKLSVLSVILIGAASVANAAFVVNVQQDTVTAPTDAGLVAWNVYVVGSDGDMMASFNADFTGGDIRQVWTSVDEVWTATPYRKDLDIGDGKYRNDSHLGYTAAELLIPAGNAAETNDLSVDAPTGKGTGGLWCPGDLGVINIYQSENAFLARIVLPEGAAAALDLKVWNQNGEHFTHLTGVAIPEPLTTVLLSLGGVTLLRRRKSRK